MYKLAKEQRHFQCRLAFKCADLNCVREPVKVPKYCHVPHTVLAVFQPEYLFFV